MNRIVALADDVYLTQNSGASHFCETILAKQFVERFLDGMQRSFPPKWRKLLTLGYRDPLDELNHYDTRVVEIEEGQSAHMDRPNTISLVSAGW